MKPAPWIAGNRVRLLENGEAFFPRAFDAIAQAQQEVFVETFILADDRVGQDLQAALVAAARRGARVELTVDGYGSHDLPEAFITALTRAGVRVHVYDPQPRLLGFRVNIFRRLHRKLVVIDGRRAFVGGINFAMDHLRAYGPDAKHDYAVEIEGPVVAEIRALAAGAVAPPVQWWRRRVTAPTRAPTGAAGSAAVLFAARDNQRRRDGVERHYREAIRAARHEIIVANAYFFPGYRLLRGLRDAARRGVRVHLILQGRPDMPAVRWIALTLYDYLLRGGVRIHEFCERPLHAKVAVVDGDWATVGSSNLDPLSLSLNLEANVFVRDREFNAALRARLMALVERGCREVRPEDAPRRTPWRQILTFIAFHVARRFPAWAGFLPGQGQVLPVPAAAPPPPAAPARADRRAAPAGAGRKARANVH